MAFTTEREYQTAVTKELRTHSWVYKIPDVNMQIKPFDIIYMFKWKARAVELKICNKKKWVSYEQAYAMLRPNQIAALNSFKIHWWDSEVWVWNIAEEQEYHFKFKFLDWNNQVEL